MADAQQQQQNQPAVGPAAAPVIRVA